MARFRQSVVINRPVEQVFAFISDLENDPPWSGAAEMRRTSPGPVGVGTTFQQRDRLLGRRLELTLRVVGYEPDRKVTVSTTSRRLSFSGTRMVEPVGQGVTRVTFVGGGRAGGLGRPAEPLLAAVGGAAGCGGSWAG
ncbi:MAG TPA: SRPBCC family protein [Actinomycetes bacterium]|jgi:hypothetical protein|nr:SRPBCC family protein [Actinomycetes bacterium]